MHWKNSVPIAARAAMLAGCASLDGQPAHAQAVPGASEARPQKTITNFSAGLRCMDEMLLRFGTRDVSVMLAEMQDKTGKLGAGTRDMMVSAISDMTRRSRAVKLVAFGVDNQNIVNFLTNLQKQNQFALVPQYDIRGALTQFDTDAERRQAGFGVSVLNLLGFRLGRDSTVSVLAFDASVIQTADLTLVSGATSKNTIVIVREESGLGEGTATVRKVGFSFNTTFTRPSCRSSCATGSSTTARSTAGPTTRSGRRSRRTGGRSARARTGASTSPTSGTSCCATCPPRPRSRSRSPNSSPISSASSSSGSSPRNRAPAVRWRCG